MLINTHELKNTLKLKGFSVSDIATLLDLSRQNLSLRINNKTDFRLDEVQIISDYLELNDKEIINIFFPTLDGRRCTL